MESKKIEVIIIENDIEVVHRSVSNVYHDSNTYNVVIQALIEELTGTKPTTKVRVGAIPLTKDKFAQAVPAYIPPEVKHGLANEEFHPDLVKEGVAPTVVKAVENGIPVVKLDMKSILKGAK